MEKVKENKSPDSAKLNNKSSPLIAEPSSDKPEKISKPQNSLDFCSDKDNCLSLNDILHSFNAPLSEEQAWSLIYQSVLLYRNFIRIEFIDKHTKKDATQKSSHRIKVPKSTKNLNVHKDGSVHISDNGEFGKKIQKRILEREFEMLGFEPSFGYKFNLLLRNLQDFVSKPNCNFNPQGFSQPFTHHLIKTALESQTFTLKCHSKRKYTIPYTLSLSA